MNGPTAGLNMGYEQKIVLCQKPKVKVQFTLEQATKAQRGVDV